MRKKTKLKILVYSIYYALVIGLSALFWYTPNNSLNLVIFIAVFVVLDIIFEAIKIKKRLFN
jgi:hypothetical protein